MSKLPGGRVASAVALLFAAGGVAAAEPVAEQVVEAQQAPHGLCFKATEASAEPGMPDTICGRATGEPDTICGHLTLVPDTMCAHASVTPEGMCTLATEAEDQPSTWCLIATED